MSETAGRPSHPVAADPGTSVLVAGPAMTDKRSLAYDLLAGDHDPDGTAVTFVTTRKSDPQVRQEFRTRCPGLPADRFAVVDCVSRERGRWGDGGDTTRNVSHAGDLTGIGIGVTEFLRRFRERDGVARSGVGLHTLSTLLMYSDLRRVFQFVHVLTGRIASIDAVGVFVVDTPVAGNAFEILKQAFDGLVEVRDTAAGSEYRVRGIEGPRSWTAR